MTARAEIKKKRASAKTAKNKADDLFSKIVRSRGVCIGCGERRYDLLQTAHIFSRNFARTRTDETNAYCACASCHANWHLDPVGFGLFAMAQMGEAGYWALYRKAHAVEKFDWHDELERLTLIWAGLQ